MEAWNNVGHFGTLSAILEQCQPSWTLAPWNAETRWNISEHLFTGVLNDDQHVVLVGCNHDLVFLGADAQEGEVVLGVGVSHTVACLCGERVHEARVLHRRRVVHRRAHRDPLAVDDDEADDSLVTLDPFERLLYF